MDMRRHAGTCQVVMGGAALNEEHPLRRARLVGQYAPCAGKCADGHAVPRRHNLSHSIIPPSSRPIYDAALPRHIAGCA